MNRILDDYSDTWTEYSIIIQFIILTEIIIQIFRENNRELCNLYT